MNSAKHRLVAILFSDIQGYSAMMEERESYALTILDRYEKVTRHFIEIHQGELIKTYGDGSLAIFNSTVNAVSCARDMQLSFREEPSVPLRIGIHVGEVIEKGNDVFGNAVNIASRIESICRPGGVLLSNVAHDRVKNHEEFSLQNIGSFEFHNIEEKIPVFALTNEGLGIPDRKNMEGKLKRKRKSRRIPILLASIVTLLVLVFAYRQLFTDNKIHIVTSKKAEVAKQKALAILPFENMSTLEENKYFADGMHDDLLTFLSKSKHLKVISRNSVSKLRSKERSIKEIAKILGVTHIMEGSVRRNKEDQVRINVALIDANEDNSLWAETYDRQLSPKNIFDIQSDIADKISKSLLQSIFLPEDEPSIAVYTENLTAYENYLRARQLKETGSKESLYEAKRLLEEALALDSDFAEALTLLGNLHIHLVYYAGEDPDVFFPRGWDYMEKGMAINPNLSEAHALKGSFFHWWKRDFEGAQQSYEKAIELNPNNDNAYYGYAIAYQDLNLNFTEISRLLQKALSINPLNPNLINTSGIYTRENGDVNEAIRIFKKGIEIAPEHANIWTNYAGSYYHKFRIDSAAMINHQCIEQNGRVGIYLRTYLGALSNLAALPELLKEIEMINDSSREESIIKHSFLRDYNLQKRNFTAVNELTEQLSKYNAQWLNIDIIRLNDLYFQRKYHDVIRMYEDVFPELNVASFTEEELGITMGYVYSLFQTGNKEKGQEILSQIEIEKLQDRDNRDLRVFDKLFLDYVGSCAAIMNQEEAKAIDLLENHLTKGSSFNLRWIEIDPIFQSLSDNPRYTDLIESVKSEIGNQRESFLKHLNEKGSTL